MEKKDKEKLTELLIRVKKVNKVYQGATEEQRERLLDVSEKTIQDLMGYGYRREFLIGLLIGGTDFLKSLGVVEGLDDNQLTLLVFG